VPCPTTGHPGVHDSRESDRTVVRLRTAPLVSETEKDRRLAEATMKRPAPGQYFTVAGRRPSGRILTVEPKAQLTGQIMGATMSYVLTPSDEATRLLLKVVVARGLWLAPLLSVGDLIMARRQLLNLKRLAEQSVKEPRT